MKNAGQYQLACFFQILNLFLEDNFKIHEK